MDEKLIDKLEIMLKGPDREMRSLAVSIFRQESKGYEDYSELRKRFPYTVHRETDIFLTEMFETYSAEHIQEKFREYAEVWRRQRMEDLQSDKVGSLGKTDVIKKTARYYTKDQQNAAGNKKNK